MRCDYQAVSEFGGQFSGDLHPVHVDRFFIYDHLLARDAYDLWTEFLYFLLTVIRTVLVFLALSLDERFNVYFTCPLYSRYMHF